MHVVLSESFIRKKPETFKEAFYVVFGESIESKEDILLIAEELCNLKDNKMENGKVIKRREIYAMRKCFPRLGIETNNHHWPPGSRGGEETLKIPKDFHEAWHIIFLNLYGFEEVQEFLDKLFKEEDLEDFQAIHFAIQQIIRKRVD